MSAAPRVLVAGAVLGQPMGGVRRHNVELLPRAARLLAERGGGLSILAGREPLPPSLEALALVASDVPPSPPWRRARAESAAVRRALADGLAVDLFHAGHLPLARVELPTTLTLHDLRDLELPARSLVRRLAAPHVLRAALRRARTVITVSETVRRSILARAPGQRVVLVPNAADHLRVLERVAGARSKGPLLHVGHVEPRKNLALLLRALALDETLGRLVLAGAPKHGEDERLRLLARSLGVEPRVAFLGAVSDERMGELLASASCVVLPSSLEGFGIGVLEAQRAGVPLAVSTAGALREVAGDDVPSFAPDDPAAAAHAIRAARDTPDATLAARAERAARFSWDRSAGLLVDAWCTASVTFLHLRGDGTGESTAQVRVEESD